MNLACNSSIGSALRNFNPFQQFFWRSSLRAFISLDRQDLQKTLANQGTADPLLVELAYEQETRPTRTLEEDLRRSRLYAEKIFFG